jgi:hypothetical protein
MKPSNFISKRKRRLLFVCLFVSLHIDHFLFPSTMASHLAVLDLDDNVLQRVFLLLDLKDAASVGRTCKRCFSLSIGDDYFWQRHFVETFKETPSDVKNWKELFVTTLASAASSSLLYHMGRNSLHMSV